MIEEKQKKLKVNELTKGQWIELKGGKYQILSISRDWRSNEDALKILDDKLAEHFYDEFDFVFDDIFEDRCLTLNLYNKKMGCMLFVKRSDAQVLLFHSDEASE